MTQILRVDDVSVATDLHALEQILAHARAHWPSLEVWLGVSPLIADQRHTPDPQRIFPRIWNAHSDHRLFYEVDTAGLPDLRRLEPFTIASHGLVHVDHRLLGYEAQEFSIVTSCHLLDSWVFIPPFNHWNRDTEAVCEEHNLTLVKFEDGWRSIEHEAYDPEIKCWFLHPHMTTPESFAAWLP